jgi:hypothetical protein
MATLRTDRAFVAGIEPAGLRSRRGADKGLSVCLPCSPSTVAIAEVRKMDTKLGGKYGAKPQAKANDSLPRDTSTESVAYLPQWSTQLLTLNYPSRAGPEFGYQSG